MITVNNARVGEKEAYFTVGIMDPANPRMAVHSVVRTCSQLRPIVKRLSEIDPDLELTEIPFRMFGALVPEFIEAQRCAMEAYLNEVATSHLLCFDADFLNFVGYDAAAKERLMRSYLLLELSHSLTLRSCIANLVTDERSDAKCVAVARCWLRSRDDFVFIRTLPPLTHPSWPCRKTSILVGDSSRRQFFLTVQPIRECSILFGASIEKVKRVRQMLLRLNSNIFAPLTEMGVVEDGHLVSLRPVYSAGSLFDVLFDAVTPLDSSKFSLTVKGVSSNRLHQIAQELFRIIKTCHAYGFTLPNMTPGNVLVSVVSDEFRLSLSGLEDILSGNSWMPLLAAESHELLKSQTHIDVLLFGAVLYQLATGEVLSPERLESLLMCQGDPLSPQCSPIDEIKIAPQNHPLKPSLLTSLNPEVANLLHFIFHPSLPADERVLEHHAFLRSSSTVVETSEGLYAAPAPAESLSMKKKDMELMVEQIAKFDRERECREQRKARYEQARSEFAGKGRGLSALIDKRKAQREKKALTVNQEPSKPPASHEPLADGALQSVDTRPLVQVTTTIRPPDMPDFPQASDLPPPPPASFVPAQGDCGLHGSHASPQRPSVPPPPLLDTDDDL